MIPLHTQKAPGIAFWLVDIDGTTSTLNPVSTMLLSDAERAQADRFHFECDARRYRASHVALRTLLSKATGIAARELEFGEGPFGKPRLEVPGAPHFNMSHSGGWALIGIGGDAPIGVDIEVQRPIDDLSALAHQNFTSAEFEALEAEAPEAMLRTFLRCWTRKEACLKALGSGLSIEPGGVEVGVGAGHRATHIQMSGETCHMTVVSLELPARALAAVAWIAGTDRHLAL